MDTFVAGRLLVASPILVDPNFARTVVLVLQHDSEGALGVVLNRPTEEEVEAHLPEWAPRLEEPPVVFLGGPVEPAIAIGVVRSQSPPEPTALGGVGMVDLGADPASAPAGPVRIFSGYAGWGAGQLEIELAEEAWIVVDALPTDVFTDRPEGLWSVVLRRQRGELAMLAAYPADPSLN
jgi:putative transcriptional regulator